jgi:hypothetical protein
MIRLAPAALISSAVFLSAHAAHADAVSLPPGFDGLYATEGTPCGGALSQQITVEDGVILFMDGAMSVTDLIEFPGEPNKVEVSLLASGGGGEWTESAVIELSSNETGQALVVDYPDGNRSIWVRCGDLP